MTIKSLDKYEEHIDGCVSFECSPILAVKAWALLACKEKVPLWLEGTDLVRYANLVEAFANLHEGSNQPNTKIEVLGSSITLGWKGTWTKDRFLEIDIHYSKSFQLADYALEDNDVVAAYVRFNTGTGKESRFLTRLFNEVFDFGNNEDDKETTSETMERLNNPEPHQREWSYWVTSPEYADANTAYKNRIALTKENNDLRYKLWQLQNPKEV